MKNIRHSSISVEWTTGKETSERTHGVSSTVDVIIGRETLLWCHHRNLTEEIKKTTKKRGRRKSDRLCFLLRPLSFNKDLLLTLFISSLPSLLCWLFRQKMEWFGLVFFLYSASGHLSSVSSASNSLYGKYSSYNVGYRESEIVSPLSCSLYAPTLPVSQIL